MEGKESGVLHTGSVDLAVAHLYVPSLRIGIALSVAMHHEAVEISLLCGWIAQHCVDRTVAAWCHEHHVASGGILKQLLVSAKIHH